VVLITVDGRRVLNDRWAWADRRRGAATADRIREPTRGLIMALPPCLHRRPAALETGLHFRALGPLAQLVEQGTLNPKVEGSNPSRPIAERLWTLGSRRSMSRSQSRRGATGGAGSAQDNEPLRLAQPRNRLTQSVELSVCRPRGPRLHAYPARGHDRLFSRRRTDRALRAARGHDAAGKQDARAVTGSWLESAVSTRAGPYIRLTSRQLRPPTLFVPFESPGRATSSPHS
jgi:hypothetical protein